MVTSVKGSAWDAELNVGYANLGDYAQSGEDVTVTMAALLAIGKAIYVPPGQFLIGSLSIPNNSVIIGIPGKSTLKLKDLTNAVALSVGSNCKLLDIRIDGNKQNQVGSGLHTIQLLNSSYSVLSRVTLANSKGDGINIAGSQTNEVVLHSVEIGGYAENGIRIASGSNISIISPRVYASDALATGDALAIVSDGTVISNVAVSDPILRGAVNRGLALIGNGARNVTDISVSGGRIGGNGTHGIHLINAERITLVHNLTHSNTQDGLRLEGDVQFVRAVNTISNNNGQFGAREVTLGSTPNNNGFVYTLTNGNANNTVTKLGAASFIT